MTSRPHSMQARLLALVFGMVMAVWLAAMAMTWFDVTHELDELLDGHLAQAAALLVVQQVSEIDDDHRVDAPTLHRYAPKVVFQVFHEGRLALRSANAPVAPMIAPGGSAEGGFRTVQIDGTAWRVFTTRGAERDVQVFVGEQMHSRAEILWAALRSMLWPMLFALPLLAIAVWWSVRSGLAPLRRLGGMLSARQPQSLQPVLLPGAPTEMAPMLEELNGLFARIGSLMESERRFTADAAHELRTPIAAIRAQAQVALAESADDRRRHALISTVEGCDRATRLVEQLLTLSRLEAGAAPAMKELDLSALVRGIVGELAVAAVNKGQSIEVDAPAPCQIKGDDTLLAVLVRNLVDNAIRYSPPNATLKVAVTRLAATIRLKVEDSGSGMPEPDLARLGERFFRVLGNNESGSGLGWSIVRRIAAAHDADVRGARSTELGGLAVEIDFPA